MLFFEPFWDQGQAVDPDAFASGQGLTKVQCPFCLHHLTLGRFHTGWFSRCTCGANVEVVDRSGSLIKWTPAPSHEEIQELVKTANLLN